MIDPRVKGLVESFKAAMKAEFEVNNSDSGAERKTLRNLKSIQEALAEQFAIEIVSGLLADISSIAKSLQTLAVRSND